MCKSTFRSVLMTLLIVAATAVNGPAAGQQPACCATPTVAPSCGCTCGSDCCTVMKTVKEVVYDEEEVTFYRTEYKEVVEKQKVDAVKYVEGTAYRCAPVTHQQLEQSPACGTSGCASSACAKPSCCPPQMKPICIMQKVPYTTYSEVPYQEEVEVKRVKAVQVPYTVTRCVPRVVCKTVPVQVCCCKAKCRSCGKCRTGCGCSH